jgi:hypothetical protein
MKLGDPEFWASVTCLLARAKRTLSMPPHLFAYPGRHDLASSRSIASAPAKMACIALE